MPKTSIRTTSSYGLGYVCEEPVSRYVGYRMSMLRGERGEDGPDLVVANLFQLLADKGLLTCEEITMACEADRSNVSEFVVGEQ